MRMRDQLVLFGVSLLACVGVTLWTILGAAEAAKPIIDAVDIVGWASADVPFAEQSGYSGQVMASWPSASTIPETGVHGPQLPNGETLRLGKVVDPVDPSRHALAFQLDPSDPVTSGGKRSEISFSQSMAPIVQDKVYWVAYSVYVYDWGRLADNDVSLFGTQLHSGDNSRGLSPVFSVYTANGGRDYRVQVLYSTSTDPRQSNTTRVNFDTRPIPFGRWIDFVFKFKVNPHGNGFLQAWVDGEQIVDYKGRLGFITPGYNDYQKFGYYNWSSGFSSTRKVLLRSPIIILDPTGDKYTADAVRAYVNRPVDQQKPVLVTAEDDKWQVLARITFDEGETGYKIDEGAIGTLDGRTVLAQRNEGVWARVRVTFAQPISLAHENAADAVLRYAFRVDSHGAPLVRATHHPYTASGKILLIPDSGPDGVWQTREVRLFSLAVAPHSGNKEPLSQADSITSLLFQSRSADGNTAGHSISLDYVEILVPKN